MKAFTLVELLAVIVILGIIALISIPTIFSIINDSNDNLYNSQQEIILSNSKTYIVSNMNNYEKINGNVYCITLDNLKNTNYISQDFIDNLDARLTNTKVEVKVQNNEYYYHLNINCIEVK